MSKAGDKRKAVNAFQDFEMDKSEPRKSPFLPMFEHFRVELDEHHDRRERVIKASRDITAASKKIIFALQRIRTLSQPIPPNIQKPIQQNWDAIKTQYSAISNDVQDINAYRYRSLTGGNQEFIEAITFQHYLETQTLMSFQKAESRVADLGGEGGKITLTTDDYLLGVFDMVGELMRFSITAMAINGQLPGSRSLVAPNVQPRTVLTDLHELRALLEELDVPHSGKFGIDKKLEVMQACVEKVEKAAYGMTVRGCERPKGWTPDFNQGSARKEIDGY